MYKNCVFCRQPIRGGEYHVCKDCFFKWMIAGAILLTFWMLVWTGPHV